MLSDRNLKGLALQTALVKEVLLKSDSVLHNIILVSKAENLEFCRILILEKRFLVTGTYKT